MPSLDEVAIIPHAAKTLRFSPDGKLLAGGHDSHVKLWSTESWEELQTLPDVRYPAVFSPDGKWLVTGEAGGYRVWSHPEGSQTWQRGGFCRGEPHGAEYLGQSIHGVAFSPDGRLLVTAGHPGGYETGQFQVWDFPSLKLRPGFSPQPFELDSAAFTPDSRHLLVGDRIGRLIIWDVAEGQVVDTVTEHTGGVTAISFARDGRTMATSSSDRTLVVWDWETHEVLVRLRGILGDIWSSAISPDGRMLASDSNEGIGLWDATTRRKMRMIPGCHIIIGFTTDSRQLVARGFKDCRVWRLAADEVATVPLAKFVHRLGDSWAAVHGSEPYAAFGQVDGTLEYWNLATMSPIASWKVHEGAVDTVAFSPDGQLIATSGPNGDVKLWDSKTYREVQRFTPRGKELRCLVFSPDGRLLAGSEHMWDDPQVCIWDVHEGSLLRELDGTGGLFGPSLAFSPDGKLLATPHDDSNARLWEIPSGNLKATLKGHTGLVISVAFSPDGQTLATGSFEHNVKLWNIATQQEVASLEALPGSCVSLRFSPDGRTLAAGSVNGSETYILLWQVPSFEDIDAAEAKKKAESKQP
ncbi:MAG: WD40 repeat domain-containing protein [Pirellulales bacterium]